MSLDTSHLCIFIDGLDEIRNEDGFSKLKESILLLSQFPRTKLCVSTRPEAQIMRWLNQTSAIGFRLEDLTKLDMIVFVRKKLRPLLDNESPLFHRLRRGLVDKAQGVFLWLHLATTSIIEGITNHDPEDMLLHRLHGLPGDLEKLYIDMWQRLNANNSVYRQTAARYFRYLLQESQSIPMEFEIDGFWYAELFPVCFQIACAEDLEIQEALLVGGKAIETSDVLRLCQDIMSSIRIRCAGLLEFHPRKHNLVVGANDVISNLFGRITFIHRTAHDFLIETEAGRRILGHDSSTDFSLQYELLKGLVCVIVFSSSQWGIEWRMAYVINQISTFVRRWGHPCVPSAFEILDTIRLIYDNQRSKANGALKYRYSFLSLLTHDDRFDEFVISRLQQENSVRMATDTLREGWMPQSYMTLSKRLFDALLCMGADPHEIGDSPACDMPGSFVSKVTAFTNLLVSFYCSSETNMTSRKFIFLDRFPDISHCKRLDQRNQCDILEIAMRMARSWEKLSTRVGFVRFFSSNGDHGFMRSNRLAKVIRSSENHDTHFIVYEVNIQFLLLYLLSSASEGSVESVLGSLEAQDLLPKVNSPYVGLKYFVLSKASQAMSEDGVRVTCHRVAAHASYLTQEFIECLLQSAIPGSVTEHSFGIDFQDQSNDIYGQYTIKGNSGTIIHSIKGSEIEETDYATMIADLATGRLEFSAHA